MVSAAVVPAVVPASEDSPSEVLDLRRRKLSRLTLEDLGMLVPRSALADSLATLQVVDLSCNNLCVLPTDALNAQTTPQLRDLNLSKNLLRGTCFFSAGAAEQTPTAEFHGLAQLPRLRQLDLRFNERCGEPTLLAALRSFLSLECGAECAVLASPWGQMEGARPSERDASLLRAQLEPWPTKVLRARLVNDFPDANEELRASTDAAEMEREEVMQRLLECYRAEGLAGPLDAAACFPGRAGGTPGTPGTRRLVHTAGAPVDADMLWELHLELCAWAARQDKAGRMRERPSIRSRNYLILRRPEDGEDGATGEEMQPSSGRANRKAHYHGKKMRQNRALWELALRIVTSVDPEWAKTKFCHLAVTQNFEGSPHIDKQNTGAFYGLSLGDFVEGAGGICVECDVRTVALVNTRHRLGKVDGRFPHWVAPWRESGSERFSLIFYQTEGNFEQPEGALCGASFEC
mmetsp:Transcript_27520/g.49174  ORF Transcript_27520/g.49174 Transcript_27520/m.49174 type:complete len:462 (-) Transcript_27520:361-1746(-)